MEKKIGFLFVAVVAIGIVISLNLPGAQQSLDSIEQDTAKPIAVIDAKPVKVIEKLVVETSTPIRPTRDILVIDDPRIPQYIRDAAPDTKTRIQMLDALNSYPFRYEGGFDPNAIKHVDHLTGLLDIVPDELALSLLSVALTEGKYYRSAIYLLIKTLSSMQTVESAEALVLIYRYAPIIVEHRLMTKYNVDSAGDKVYALDLGDARQNEVSDMAKQLDVDGNYSRRFFTHTTSIL